MIIASANLIKDGKPVKDAPIIGNSCVSFGFENPENYSKSMAASIKEVQFEVVDFLNKSFKPSGFEEM